MKVLGLDGCKRDGWVVARSGPEFDVVRDLRLLLQQAASGAVRLVLDVPIGLIGSGRMCDTEARSLLKERRSSVFTPPGREAIAATSREEASRLNFAACGKKVSSQAFGILERIRAVDQLMRPDLQDRVHEGHPEISFAVLAGRPMKSNKKTPDGRTERLRILATTGLEFDLEEVRLRLAGRDVGRDDIIDAAVMLATAIRIEEGAARRLPRETQQRDARGLSAEIWA